MSARGVKAVLPLRKVIARYPRWGVAAMLLSRSALGDTTVPPTTGVTTPPKPAATIPLVPTTPPAPPAKRHPPSRGEMVRPLPLANGGMRMPCPTQTPSKPPKPTEPEKPPTEAAVLHPHAPWEPCFERKNT